RSARCRSARQTAATCLDAPTSMPTATLMAPSSWLLDPRGSPPPHGSRSLISDLRSLAVGSQSPLADMERGPATTLIGPLPPGRAPVSPLESPHSGLLQLSISGRGGPGLCREVDSDGVEAFVQGGHRVLQQLVLAAAELGVVALVGRLDGLRDKGQALDQRSLDQGCEAAGVFAHRFLE